MPYPSTDQFSGFPIEFSQAPTHALDSLMHFHSLSVFLQGQLHAGLMSVTDCCGIILRTKVLLGLCAVTSTHDSLKKHQAETRFGARFLQ